MSGTATALERFSEEVTRKGEHLHATEDAVEQDSKHPQRWWVWPYGRDGVMYTVMVLSDEGEIIAQCSCPNGQRTGSQGRCYHKVAVLLEMEER